MTLCSFTLPQKACSKSQEMLCLRNKNTYISEDLISIHLPTRPPGYWVQDVFLVLAQATKWNILPPPLSITGFEWNSFQLYNMCLLSFSGCTECKSQGEVTGSLSVTALFNRLNKIAVRGEDVFQTKRFRDAALWGPFTDKWMIDLPLEHRNGQYIPNVENLISGIH